MSHEPSEEEVSAHRRRRQIAAVLGEIDTTSFDELAPLMGAIADKLCAHRAKNGGHTPKPIFKSAIEMGMSYSCVELVLSVEDGNGVQIGAMLKERQASDQGWQGLKTIPGVSLMPLESLRIAQERLLGEFTFDPELRNKLWEQFADTAAYIEVHREDTDVRVEGRRVNCMTAVYTAVIYRGDIHKLLDGLTFVKPEDFCDETIVDHHSETLRAVW